jgi:hypothetical protein
LDNGFKLQIFFFLRGLIIFVSKLINFLSDCLISLLLLIKHVVDELNDLILLFSALIFLLCELLQDVCPSLVHVFEYIFVNSYAEKAIIDRDVELHEIIDKKFV